MEDDPTQIDRIQQYLRRITPQARRNLLVEIERMQIYGEDMPCSEIILAELRAEFRNSGESQHRVGNPSRHFFKPIEILFVDRAAELANSGQIRVAAWRRSGNGSSNRYCRQWRRNTAAT